MSNYIRLANLIELYSINFAGGEEPKGFYTNGCQPGSSIFYDRKRFVYLSFIYQGAAKNRSGDNLEAALVLSTNQISTDLAAEAVRNRYHLRVWSVKMQDNREEVAERGELTKEDWVVASMVYDSDAVEVVLSSSIDAVGANAPTRVLTRKQVGALPVTGNIQAQ